MGLVMVSACAMLLKACLMFACLLESVPDVCLMFALMCQPKRFSMSVTFATGFVAIVRERAADCTRPSTTSAAAASTSSAQP